MAESVTTHSPSKPNHQKSHKKKHHKKKHHKKKHAATELEDVNTSPARKSSTVENATKSQSNSSNIVETKTGQEIIETKNDSVAPSTVGNSVAPSKNEEDATKSIDATVNTLEESSSDLVSEQPSLALGKDVSKEISTASAGTELEIAKAVKMWGSPSLEKQY